MGVLAIIVAGLALAGCYQPALRDCTVHCESPGDCAGGQVCGSDGLCATPEIAGRCARLASDAGTPGDAAAPPGDASSDAPDAPTLVRLTVLVMGKGSIVLDGSTTCSALAPQRGNCGYDVVPGIAITAQAVAIEADHPFTNWSSTTCAGQGTSCTFAPDTATTISARFK
jgi:hypothetical protein